MQRPTLLRIDFTRDGCSLSLPANARGLVQLRSVRATASLYEDIVAVQPDVLCFDYDYPEIDGLARIRFTTSHPNDMDEALIANWNAVVRPDDIVYHLGDFAFQLEQRADRWRSVFARLMGRKRLIIAIGAVYIEDFERLAHRDAARDASRPSSRRISECAA